MRNVAVSVGIVMAEFIRAYRNGKFISIPTSRGEVRKMAKKKYFLYIPGDERVEECETKEKAEAILNDWIDNGSDKDDIIIVYGEEKNTISGDLRIED